jgi:hypothetical protein
MSYDKLNMTISVMQIKTFVPSQYDTSEEENPLSLEVNWLAT